MIVNVGGLTSAQFGAHWDALRSLVLGICDARRADPGGDMIGDLIVGNIGERAIPEANLVGLLFSLIAALGHSPITQISYGLVTLLRHPDQWDLLIRRPELVHAATAEILRYGVAFEVEHVRVAKEDVEVGAVRIARGDAVLTSIAAANRDETKFADPTRFDITRADNDHLAFGHGPHVCAGSDLAKFMPDLTAPRPTHAHRSPAEKDSKRASELSDRVCAVTGLLEHVAGLLRQLVCVAGWLVLLWGFADIPFQPHFSPEHLAGPGAGALAVLQGLVDRRGRNRLVLLPGGESESHEQRDAVTEAATIARNGGFAQVDVTFSDEAG